MAPLSKRSTELLIRWRWPLLALGAVLALNAQWFTPPLEFDRSIENMFADDDPLLPPYHKLKRTFGGNEIVLVVYRDEQLFDKNGEGLDRLGEISKDLREVKGVQDVLSLWQVHRLLTTTGQSILDPTPDGTAALFRDLFAGYTHSRDEEVAAVACMLMSESTSPVPRRNTIDGLRAIAEDLPDDLPPGMIAGEPVMVTDGFRYLEEDGARLGRWSTILLGLTIIICFRSLRWVLVPVAVVQLTLLLTRAALVVSGLRLSMVSSMLTAIVTVIGVATVVHIIVRFRHARRCGWSQRGALIQAGRLLVLPILGACLTDAVGFTSLLITSVGPVQDFGVMMAIGSLLVLVAAVLVVPGLAVMGRFDADPRRAWGEDSLDVGLSRTVALVERAPRLLGAAVAALVVFAVAGATQLEVETDFTNNFLPGSPIVKSYRFVESKLGGAGVWDIIVTVPKDQPIDKAYLDRVLDFEAELRKLRDKSSSAGESEPALTKVISLADADLAARKNDLIPRILNNPEIRLRGMMYAMPTFTSALVHNEPDDQGQRYLRIMLRAKESQPAAQKKWLIAEVQRLADQAFPPRQEQPQAEVTGFFVLLTNLIDSLIRDQWLTFAAAAAGIGLMMWIAFRSLSLALIALAPNVLPILIVLGSLGWLSLKMNMGAAMIAAVSMGLSVDSSIHYITSFRRARAAGKSLREALDEVQQTVGRAMVFSTLALVVGFTTLCTSQFVPTIYFGVLVSLAMLGGLVGNLIVLPLLLRAVTRDAK